MNVSKMEDIKMSKKPVKIVTIGGGSSYTPELMEGFITVSYTHLTLPTNSRV